jgi:hypothetical protein
MLFDISAQVILSALKFIVPLKIWPLAKVSIAVFCFTINELATPAGKAAVGEPAGIDI